MVKRISIFISPVYILRRGLAEAIEENSIAVTGDVLDFGCGSKPYVSLFKNASSYVGVDLRHSGHDHSRSLIDVFYDGKVLPFSDQCFDSIVSFEVFEHISNLEEVLIELLRVLKPNGFILVSTPFCWGEHEEPFDFIRLTSFGMKSMFERNNLEIMNIQKTNTSFLAVSQLLISYISNFVLPHGRILGIFSQLFIVFPLNVLALFLNAVFPKRYESFSNLVISAQKV